MDTRPEVICDVLEQLSALFIRAVNLYHRGRWWRSAACLAVSCHVGPLDLLAALTRRWAECVFKVALGADTVRLAADVPVPTRAAALQC